MESRIGRDYESADNIPLLNNNTTRRASSTANRLGSLFQDWWLWEVVGATTCVLALSVIIIILAVFDASSLPDWPSVFTVRCITSHLISGDSN